MEITAIKQQLTMMAVLQNYGLQPDKHYRLHCPFHNDKTPSLQIYPTTNTFCCFSSNCMAGTGDVIQFIQLKENCTKHEALLKAATLAGGTSVAAAPAPAAQLFIEQDKTPQSSMDKTALLAEIFQYYKSGLYRSKKAVDYLQSRSINYKLTEAAFNSGGLHVENRYQHLVQSMVQYGLLKARPAGGYNVWGKDCILFPLKDIAGNIVSLYGRSITNDKEQRHFYLTGREGLYPGYPEPATTKLILTESIIDAVSLLQQEGIASKYEVLALYGTKGLTEEHQQAIVQWANSPSTGGGRGEAEVILMLNADEPGDAATAKHTVTLQQLLPAINISKISLPAGEDVNSLLQGHDAKLLIDLIEQRTELSFSNPVLHVSRDESKKVAAETLPRPSSQHSKLNTQNPELLIYDNGELYIEILGGIKITGLDRMKVTLKILHKEKLHNPQWYSIDLYNQVQREQTINSVTETFETPTQATTQAFIQLITALESYRLQRIESLQPKQEQLPELTPAQRQAAVSELKKSNLLQRTSQLIQQSGIVGETTNSLIAYLVYCTRKQLVPLHVMFLGSSGSGKTWLQERISDLIPQEDKIEITQITENALYYFKQHELQNKLILIEDLDGAMTVFYPLRELQTKRRISKTVTLKDSKGNLKTITLTVEGPVCVSGCTTKEKIYEDNANRCLLLYTDMTKDQDKRINEYQAKLAGGEINREREQQYKELFKNMQRVLRPINIINPYAKYIQLPEQVFKPRRTMTLLLGFIEAVTFYHQYQREVKKDASGQLYITTTVEDIEAAFNLLKDVLFSKSDELTKATRHFFEHLKVHIEANQLSSFKAQDIRKLLRMEPRTIQRYMKELAQYGYIKRISNPKGRNGFEYTVTETDEYNRLTAAIDSHIATVLNSLPR